MLRILRCGQSFHRISLSQHCKEKVKQFRDRSLSARFFDKLHKITILIPVLKNYCGDYFLAMSGTTGHAPPPPHPLILLGYPAQNQSVWHACHPTTFYRALCNRRRRETGLTKLVEERPPRAGAVTNSFEV